MEEKHIATTSDPSAWIGRKKTPILPVSTFSQETYIPASLSTAWSFRCQFYAPRAWLLPQKCHGLHCFIRSMCKAKYFFKVSHSHLKLCWFSALHITKEWKGKANLPWYFLYEEDAPRHRWVRYVSFDSIVTQNIHNSFPFIGASFVKRFSY